MKRVNCQIPLAKTQIQIIGGNGILEGVSANVVLRLSPVPRVFIDIKAELHSLVHFKIPTMPGEQPLKIRLPSGLEIEASITKAYLNGVYRANLALTQQPVTAIQTGYKLQSVRFNVVNLPDFKCRLRADDETGTVRLQASPWCIKFKAVPELSEVKKTLNEESGYGITHEGSIQRVDGELFSVEEAQKLLFGLYLFLSFARGASCGVTLISGSDKNDEQAWEQWGIYPTHPWLSLSSWFDESLNGETLSEVFPGFWCQLEQSPDAEYSPIRLALYWYLRSNESNALAAGIVLTQAALERLARIILPPESYKELKFAAARLRAALEETGIDPKIPQSCQKLEAFRKSIPKSKIPMVNGPDTLTYIRNALVHSDDTNICEDAYFESWDVGRWYAELLLLNLFKYDGRYINRLKQKYEDKFKPEIVPWARDDVETE